MSDTRHPTELAFVTAMAKATAPTPAKSPKLFGLTAGQVRKLAARALVRDPDAAVVIDAKGKPIADSDRRDTENIPLAEDVEAYLDREVRPHVPGTWCPDPAGRIGYEIPFTRLFYKYAPPRPSAEIKAELKELEGEIHRLLAAVVG